MTRLLALDCETGGLNPETDALLSVGLVDWVEGLALRRLEILIDVEGLECSPQALAVNGIDLDAHHAFSVPRAEAAEQIAAFCAPMQRPFVLGHNVTFDLGFVRRLFTPDAWRRVVSHRWVDTLTVLAYLGHRGDIPTGIGTLDQAVAYFGIVVPPRERHTALGDALATGALYAALLKVGRAAPVGDAH